MSTLTQFLIENPVDGVTNEVIISERLAKFPFKITAMTGDQFGDYQSRAAQPAKGKQKVKLDTKLFQQLIVLNHTVEPNFKDAETIKKAGCTSPEQFLYQSLLAGEIVELANQISILSGFNQDLDDLVDEAKNS